MQNCSRKVGETFTTQYTVSVYNASGCEPVFDHVVSVEPSPLKYDSFVTCQRTLVGIILYELKIPKNVKSQLQNEMAIK